MNAVCNSSVCVGGVTLATYHRTGGSGGGIPSPGSLVGRSSFAPATTSEEASYVLRQRLAAGGDVLSIGGPQETGVLGQNLDVLLGAEAKALNPIYQPSL